MTQPPPLLVPMDVRAMVLDTTTVNLIRARMNYTNLENSQSPTPKPFQSDQANFAGTLANHGVYLHWTLPAAMRHAMADDQGRLDYPFVPNRWLVVRHYRAAGAAADAAPQAMSWVVESDALRTSDGTPYLDPRLPSPQQILMGTKSANTPAAPWTEPGGPTDYFLRAVSDSNSAFAAYQPFNQNVFSIHDDLVTQKVAAGSLSYFVLGWYTASDADLLHSWGDKTATFADRLAALDWSAPATTSGTHQTLCHGSATGVRWTPNASAPPPSPKDGMTPQIAIGNTAVDAVVAFARAAFAAPNAPLPAGLNPDEAAELLEAFQYNLLPELSKPGGEAEVDWAIRAHWFGSQPGGWRWTTTDAPQPGGAAQPVEMTDAERNAEAAWLARLNDAQAQFNSHLRGLQSLQHQLFEIWWKNRAAETYNSQTGAFPWDTSAAQFTAALDPIRSEGLIHRIRTLLAQMRAMASDIPLGQTTRDFEQAIEAFAQSKGIKPGRALKALSEPRFWQAADPVVVLSGTAHAQKLTTDTALRCRWPSDIVTGLKATIGTGGPTVSVTTAQLGTALPAAPLQAMPDPAAALYAEFFLLDPDNAALVAKTAGQTLDAAQLGALADALAKADGVTGTAPAVLSGWPWTQPWEPLFMDWQIDWYPVPFRDASGTDNWVFDGNDYDLRPGLPQPGAQSLSGRTVLTPKPSFEFKSRIDRFITENVGNSAAIALQSVEHLIDTVDGWDFLSQAFSGLSVQLASRDPVPTLAPPSQSLPGGPGSYAELIGPAARNPPAPKLAAKGRSLPPSSFEGMRSGQFAVARLTIVDAFGQTLEIVSGQTAARTSVLVADGLTVSEPLNPNMTSALVQLPPRLLQPARLDFRFDAGQGDNAILGWVLPNHIDGGLACYGADGTLYGVLSVTAGLTGQPAVNWWQAPEGPYADLQALTAAQPEFGGFLSGLETAGPEALGQFLSAIDETLWTVDPLGDRSDTFLSVILGRPLALVGATVALELETDALRDPAWPYTFAAPPPDPAFLAARFPVQIGNVASRRDGLLGYFVDDSFDHMNAVHVPQPASGGTPSPYLVQIGQGNFVDLGFAASGRGTPRKLALLMDPRTAVHAQTGLFPVKDVFMPPEWVDGAIAQMKATFRSGPVLGDLRQIIPDGQTQTVDSLVMPRPAERHGTWQWRQREGDGTWSHLPLFPADGSPSLPAETPILREGVLQLSGGLGK